MDGQSETLLQQNEKQEKEQEEEHAGLTEGIIPPDVER